MLVNRCLIFAHVEVFQYIFQQGLSGGTAPLLQYAYSLSNHFTVLRMIDRLLGLSRLLLGRFGNFFRHCCNDEVGWLAGCSRRNCSNYVELGLHILTSRGRQRERPLFHSHTLKMATSLREVCFLQQYSVAFRKDSATG